MSSFFNNLGESVSNMTTITSNDNKLKDNKEKEDVGKKRSSMPKTLKKAVKSFDVTGGLSITKTSSTSTSTSTSNNNSNKSDNSNNDPTTTTTTTTTVPPKRSSMPKLFGSSSHDGSSNDLNASGDVGVSAPLTLLSSHSSSDKLARRSSMGNVANKAVSNSASVMRSTLFAPVVAGKAMMQGSVKAVQGSVKAGQLVVDQSIKTTSNIAKAAENTVISGSKAVVGGGKAVYGGGKAIVGGTTSVVEYGGKRLVKGTKGMVKGIKSATSLKTFSSRNLDEKKSKWEKGIEIIEALLEPGTDTYEAMTPEQRKELASVKKLLITGPGGGDKIAHIPRDLIKMKKRESFDVVGERRLSSNFILQEFAGVKDPSLLGDGSELDTSESTDDGDIEPIPATTDKRSKSPVRARSPIPRGGGIRPKMQKENSHSSLGSLASLQRGFGNITHDDPELDVFNFVPIEFKMLSKDSQMELYNMLSWNSINKWDFDIFRLNKLTKRRPLLFIGWAILGSPYAQGAMAKQIGLDYEAPTDEPQGYDFMDELMIPPQKLCNYLRVIELDYRAENPYHNAIHAADVMQSLHTLIQMSLEEPFLAGCPQIKLFTILLAAAIHDVDHPGKTNAFHTNSRTELAVMYNDTSVLENWHVAHAFARMLDMKLTGSNCIHDSQVIAQNKSQNEQANKSENNFLCNAHPEQFKAIRNLMIEAVLHTDMTKHFAMVNAAKGLLRQQYKEDNTWKVLMFMLHMADISGQAKADPLFKKWTVRCMDEFFAQGDEEAALGLPISPNCDRNSIIPADSQVGFIKYVVGPAYEVLGMFVPFVQNHVLKIIDQNLSFWVEQMDNPDDDAMRMDDSSHVMSNSERIPHHTDLDASDVSRLGESHRSQAETNGVAYKLATDVAANGPVQIEA